MSQMHLISKPIAEDEAHIYYKDFLIQVMRKPYQRSIYLRVKNKGRLVVSCGLRTSLKEICIFVDEKKEWIEKQLDQSYEEEKKYPRKRFLQGEKFPFCGELKTLQFSDSSKIGLSIEGLSLQAHNFTSMNECQRQAHLIQFYKHQGRVILQNKISYYSQLMNLYPNKVSFRSQKTMFGSCSEDRKISLNWTLVAAEDSVMNYVVIHELAHLKYMDHSPRFWNLVAQYQPSYFRYKKWLQNNLYFFRFLQNLN